MDEEVTSTDVAVVTATADIDPPEAELVAPLEAVRLPIFALQAALLCVAKDKYQGVHIAAAGDSEIRISATDGHRAFLFSLPVAGEMPKWLGQSGVTLPLAGLGERLKLLEKLGGETAIVAFQVNAPKIVVSDPDDQAVFRMTPAAGDFPELQPIIDKLNLGARQMVDLDSVSYEPAYLKGVGAMAAVLGAEQVRVFGTAVKEGDPSLITFPGCPGAVLIIMPMTRPERIEPATVRVLDGAVAGTVSALKAHRTRWVQKLEHAAGERAKKTIEAKVAAYDQRIAAILDHTAAPALPPPSLMPEEVEEFEHFDAHQPDAPVPDTDPEMFRARLRRQKDAAAAPSNPA